MNAIPDTCYATTVILMKGHKGERQWEHDTTEAALRRADALVEMHGRRHTCYQEVLVPDIGWQIWVDASHYYDSKRCAKHSVRFMLPSICPDCQKGES